MTSHYIIIIPPFVLVRSPFLMLKKITKCLSLKIAMFVAGLTLIIHQGRCQLRQHHRAVLRQLSNILRARNLAKHGGSINRGSQKWMVYCGKSYLNGWFRGTPILGNLHINWTNVENLPENKNVMLNVDISVHYLMSKLSNVKRKHGKLNKYGATLTLLRAGIAEGLRIFEMPCRWTFSM